jgi:hypothetical protein
MKRSRFLCAWFLLVLAPLAVAEDPDFGNDKTTAQTIATDGTQVYGELTAGDTDFFTFATPGQSMYRIWMTNQNGNWKQIIVYQANEFGDLVQVISWWQNGNGGSRTIFLDYNRPCYFQVTNDGGGYWLSVEALGTTAIDSFSNLCDFPTPIVVDADATAGTLDHSNPLEYDRDWFVFQTEPLHMYRIQMSRVDNCDVYFEVYDAGCLAIIGGTLDATVTSWYGENYKIYVRGSASMLGNYYTLKVTDLGLYPDDNQNTYDVATPIPTDGTRIDGTIQYNSTYHSDQDWFTFTPDAYGLYRLKLANSNGNWKQIELFQADIFGNLVLILNWWSNNDSQARIVHLEYPRPIYIRISGDGGNYAVFADYFGIYPPDNFSNSCQEPSEIGVNDQAIDGVLNHTTPYDEDWFVFHTEPLHTYRILLTRVDNCSAAFEVYPASCGAAVIGNSFDVTVTSWHGEDYKIRVNGSAASLGNYYTLQVTDIATQIDDFPNTPAEATTIRKDGQFVEGKINYNTTYGSDQDWTTFIAGRDGQYEFSLHNLDGNWKQFFLYSTNEVGQPIELTSFWTNNNTVTQSYSLKAGKYYVRVHNEGGNYRLRVLSPEPRCGDLDHPYPLGDVSGPNGEKDCVVNIHDLAAMASTWLKCTNPNPPCNFKP